MLFSLIYLQISQLPTLALILVVSLDSIVSITVGMASRNSVSLNLISWCVDWICSATILANFKSSDGTAYIAIADNSSSGALVNQIGVVGLELIRNSPKRSKNTLWHTSTKSCV